MLVKSSTDGNVVNWGNGSSRRLLVEDDGMGFAVAHTVVTAGTSSKLQYRNHLEACYCVSGRGAVIDVNKVRHEVTPGMLYALNEHDAHDLVADMEEDLVLISIFNPPIAGTEFHELSADGYSCY